LLDKSDSQYTLKRAQRQSAIEKSLEELSEKLASDMICKFESKRFIRGAYYLTTQLLTRAYHQGKWLYICSSSDVISDSIQVSMSLAKRSYVYEKLQRRQRRTSKASSSCLVISLMWTMFPCNLSATDWALPYPRLWQAITLTFQRWGPFYSMLVWILPLTPVGYSNCFKVRCIFGGVLEMTHCIPHLSNHT
jgi:hypothetical protein